MVQPEHGEHYLPGVEHCGDFLERAGGAQCADELPGGSDEQGRDDLRVFDACYYHVELCYQFGAVMPRINLPAGCAGFADGDRKYLAEKGAGSFVNLDSDRDANALRKLKNQDYASAGLIDAGPQKEFIRDPRQQGRWCRACNFLGHAWMRVCSKCGGETIPEKEMEHPQMDEFIP